LDLSLELEKDIGKALQKLPGERPTAHALADMLS